ncbi:MAG: GNAT family N-acetyltransferase [Actinomycetota bacterium]
MTAGITIRVAEAGDIPAATRTIASAFTQDPAWGWALEGAAPSAVSAWWSFLLTSALRYPWLRVTGACESVALWIPPGGTELTPTEEEEIEPFISALANDRARLLPEIIRLFEENHPRDEPHFYLSLWGTHADRRGAGFGGALILGNLAEIDRLHMPAYLESTNDANLDHYGRLGFGQRGSFTLPEGGPTVTTMWRPAR